MRLPVFITATLAAVLPSFATEFLRRESHPILERFHNWAYEFRIEFETESHFYETFAKWADNDEFISIVNKENRGYTLAHNQFSGMDQEDWSRFLENQVDYYDNFELSEQQENVLNTTALPASIDWTTLGAVTPVKDQGQCGSCWTFSTTGALEGAFFIKYNKLVSFSEEQLVDCDNLKNGGKDHGCNGGLMDNAFSWINKNGGLCTEDSYPYVSGNGPTGQACQKTCTLVSGSKIQKYIDVQNNNDNAMMSALVVGPVSVAIEADQREFQLYKSGVFTAPCGTSLDHGVLVVGYGTDQSSGLDFYKVKNSWGTSWGENGYIRLGRGPQYNNGEGECGVLMEASYPVL